MPDIEPEKLRWARVTAGLDHEVAARRIGLRSTKNLSGPDRLRALESGEVAPTRRQLSNMANAYRRHIVNFHYAEIFEEENYGEDYRRLPQSVSKADRGLVDAMLRSVRIRQGIVKACLEEEDDARKLPFVGSMNECMNPELLDDSIQHTLGFVREEFRNRKTLRKAFAYLRTQVEELGVFVILADHLGNWRSTIPVEAFRGAVLADDVAPFIIINANDSPGAWSFTLLHELVHLWKGRTCVSGPVSEIDIEKLCDDAASRLLVDESELESVGIDHTVPLPQATSRISAFASKCNVSRTLVAYRLHRAGRWGYDRYQEFRRTCRRDYLNHRSKQRQLGKEMDSQPGYFVVRKHRIGEALIQLVRRLVHEGRLSRAKAGKALGVKAINVHRIIN